MKLTNSDVRKIRTTHKNTKTTVLDLAQKYGVAISTIHNIIAGNTHKNPRYQPPTPKQLFDIEYAKRLRNKGKTYSEIAALEAKRHNRKRPYSLTHISTLLMNNVPSIAAVATIQYLIGCSLR